MKFRDILGPEPKSTPGIRLATQLATNDMDLIQSLIERRESLGLTQSDLAEKLGVSQQAISKFERMESDPRMSTIRRYAIAVGLLFEHSTRPVNAKTR